MQILNRNHRKNKKEKNTFAKLRTAVYILRRLNRFKPYKNAVNPKIKKLYYRRHRKNSFFLLLFKRNNMSLGGRSFFLSKIKHVHKTWIRYTH